MPKLRVNPVALNDLVKIKTYIGHELNNPQAAIKTISSIIESYEKLREYPLLGKALSVLIDVPTDYRYLISGKYIIFYKADPEFVSIYRILYSGRDYLKILFP